MHFFGAFVTSGMSRQVSDLTVEVLGDPLPESDL